MSSLTDLIIIKVETMKKIVIDTVANTVVVGPGVKMGELITALFAQQRQTSKFLLFKNTISTFQLTFFLQLSAHVIVPV